MEAIPCNLPTPVPDVKDVFDQLKNQLNLPALTHPAAASVLRVPNRTVAEWNQAAIGVSAGIIVIRS